MNLRVADSLGEYEPLQFIVVPDITTTIFTISMKYRLSSSQLIDIIARRFAVSDRSKKDLDLFRIVHRSPFG